MKRVIVLSGVSGSGKSTFSEDESFNESHALVCSADLYFYDKEGNYNFDGAKLGEAHASCFRNFIDFLRDGYEVMIVDNTNTTESEISPYMLGAAAFGYEAEIITFMCENEDDVKVCAARNSHGVPFDKVMAQHNRLSSRSLPPRWKNTQCKISK